MRHSLLSVGLFVALLMPVGSAVGDEAGALTKVESEAIASCEKKFADAAKDERITVGEACVKELVEKAEAAFDARRLAAAEQLYRAAGKIGVPIRSAQNDHISRRLRTLPDLERAYDEIKYAEAEIKKLAQSDLAEDRAKRAKLHDTIARTYLVDLDDAMSATAYTDRVGDRALAAVLGHLAKPLADREAGSALQVAGWYAEASSDLRTFGRRRAAVHAIDNYKHAAEKVGPGDPLSIASLNKADRLQQRLAVVDPAAGASGGLAGRLFVVDAFRHATATPLKTGLKIANGQQLLFSPNLADEWYTGRGARVDYRGRVGNPSMKLRYKLGSQFGDVQPGVPVIARQDGELELFCEDSDPSKNEGFIRVSVLVVEE